MAATQRSVAARAHVASSVREGGCRILLAEDDDDISESVKVVLEDAGYTVERCRNGKEALERLRQDPADLIVLDLMMPVMDGWEFRAQQRADRAIADVPVVVITADASAKAAAVHADSYVRKPFGANELVTAVERVLLERDRKDLAARLEETERLALLGTIAAGVGHEINNPLSFTMGNLELAESAVTAIRADLSESVEAGAPGHDFGGLERIDEKLDRLASLLQDSRTGAERVRLIVRNLQSLGRRSDDRRTRLDLAKVVDSAISIVWNQIKSRAILTRVYSQGVAVAGDETRLGQVFLNLLVNACQAIHDPRPEANSIVVSIREETGVAIVEIRDSGVGMSKALAARVFEPFFTTKGQGQGTGLGLSISRDIVDAHDGEIFAESEPGQGSTFTVRLPLWSDDEYVRPSDGPKVVSSHRRLKSGGEVRKRVWIVDDDPMVSQAMGRMLGRTYEVLLTAGPLDVLRRIRAGEAFDALLCDVMMPAMSGTELAKLLAVERPELARKVVFISGSVYSREEMDLAEDPDRLFIEKPFDEAGLHRIIECASRA
jgi:two-component system NtrC family sensor kinase